MGICRELAICLVSHRRERCFARRRLTRFQVHYYRVRRFVDDLCLVATKYKEIPDESYCCCSLKRLDNFVASYGGARLALARLLRSALTYNKYHESIVYNEKPKFGIFGLW